jgi:hypothetical protein
LLLPVLLMLPGLAGAESELGRSAPRPMAPVAGDGVARVADRCPSFHWSAVEGASGYELVLYEVDQPVPVEADRVVLPPGTSWTPTVDRCLVPGRHYAWSVGAVRAGRKIHYSDPSLFEIAGPDEDELRQALDVLERYRLAEEDGSRAVEERTAPAVPETMAGRAPPSRAHRERLPSPGIAAAVKLSVDGSVRGSDFVYSSPKLRSYPVPAAAFRASQTDVPLSYFSTGYVSLDGSGNGYSALAPLYLPEDSEIEDVICEAYDNDADNSGIWTFAMIRHAYGNTGSTQISSETIDSDGASTTLLVATLSLTGLPVRNTQYQTYLSLTYSRDFGSTNTTQLRFYGCELTYTVGRVETP